MDLFYNVINAYPCLTPIFACLALSIVFVASLYVWNTPLNRDHPDTIKRRFLSVIVMSILSPFYVSFFIKSEKLKDIPVLDLIGVRWEGLVPAAVIPLSLTMVLFLGPICMEGTSGLFEIYREPKYWLGNLKNLSWLRNYVVAPLSEEFIFRACMLPLLLQCFSIESAIFVAPLFFGVAHLHHIYERLKSGIDYRTVLMLSGFQCFYTTIFGAYSAFLFIRTGHFIAPAVAHIFCNLLGFPDFHQIFTYENPHKSILIFLFFAGFFGWMLLLNPLTDPAFFGNKLFYKSFR